MPMSYEDNSAKVAEEALRLAGRGVQVAGKFLAARVKEILSVPAPRRRVTSRKGVIYYRATKAATPGAPPRKLSGQLRRSITEEYRADIQTSRIGSNLRYSRRLELGFPRGHKPHPYLSVALARYQTQLATIIGRVAGGAA